MSEISSHDEQQISTNEVEADLEFAFGENLPDGVDPEEALIESERKKAVQDAVSKLSLPLREVVVLHYFEGLPVDEVAKILGVPIGTVLSRLARAREVLRRLLAHHLDEVANEVNKP